MTVRQTCRLKELDTDIAWALQYCTFLPMAVPPVQQPPPPPPSSPQRTVAFARGVIVRAPLEHVVLRGAHCVHQLTDRVNSKWTLRTGDKNTY